VVIGVYRGALTIAGDVRAPQVAHREVLPNRLTLPCEADPTQTLWAVRSVRMAPILRSDKFVGEPPYHLTLKNFDGYPVHGEMMRWRRVDWCVLTPLGKTVLQIRPDG
jgi:hypothetical protein